MRVSKKMVFIILSIVSFSGSVDTIVFYKTGNHLPQRLWFSSFFTVDGCIDCVEGDFEFLGECFMEYFKILNMPNEK